MARDSDTRREALFLLFAQVGFHDGRHNSITAQKFRVQCSECKQFIVLADAKVYDLGGATIYKCPSDESDLVLVKGTEFFDIYGDAEVKCGDAWHHWDIHRAEPTSKDKWR